MIADRVRWIEEEVGLSIWALREHYRARQANDWLHTAAYLLFGCQCPACIQAVLAAGGEL